MNSPRLVSLLLGFHAAMTLAAEPIAIQRILPPEGVAIAESDRTELTNQVAKLQGEIERLDDASLRADCEIFTKAVDFALRWNEFYDAKKDVAKAKILLAECKQRLADAKEKKSAWDRPGELAVFGYRSTIDDSVQPYGIVFPSDFRTSGKTYPLYIWLHGRGDKATDMHFLAERMKSVGQLGKVDAVVLHAFGRQCVGFKSAGEIDVFEAREDFLRRAVTERNWPIAQDRTVLVGFSMGGAGAWHIGAHYADRFIAVAPGAGFAETAQYTKTDPATVSDYVRKLWGAYDVPCYTRNLFNTQVIAYSGENDKQIQAARVMETAFEAEGRKLEHLIGPKTAHAYEPTTLKTLVSKLAEVRTPVRRRELSLQTRTLRYSKQYELEALALEHHWEDSRIDLKRNDQKLKITTKNIAAFSLEHPAATDAEIDGISLTLVGVMRKAYFQRIDNAWKLAGGPPRHLCKRPQLQGPIDDAFLDPFLIVLPSGKSKSPAVQSWVEAESQRFIARWETLMRGKPRVTKDSEVTEQDRRRFNLICWGDATSNREIASALPKLPITWTDEKFALGKHEFDVPKHVPSLIYPNPASPDRYLVINSGLTFRDAHDKTNSQQNPKLPDWAAIDLTVPPSADAPGRITGAGFFDESWKP